VLISAPISCGQCNYCKAEKYSLCDCTNSSKLQESLYGHRTAGIFGYSHYCGGYAGLQAEYARVPFADVNTLKITNCNLRDEQILPLADILCTGFHGNELAQVSEGKTVVVWGCGPVGLMAQYIALHRKPQMVIGIDNHPYRLEVAKRLGSRVINFDDVDVTEEIAFQYPELYRELQKGRSLSYKTFFTWILKSVYQGGTIMLTSMILFEGSMYNIVSITFTTLILTELINVAFEIHTWHYLMWISEIVTVICYFLSMLVLSSYFGMFFSLNFFNYFRFKFYSFLDIRMEGYSYYRCYLFSNLFKQIYQKKIFSSCVHQTQLTFVLNFMIR